MINPCRSESINSTFWICTYVCTILNINTEIIPIERFVISIHFFRTTKIRSDKSNFETDFQLSRRTPQVQSDDFSAGQIILRHFFLQQFLIINVNLHFFAWMQLNDVLLDVSLVFTATRAVVATVTSRLPALVFHVTPEREIMYVRVSTLQTLVVSHFFGIRAPLNRRWNWKLENNQRIWIATLSKKKCLTFSVNLFLIAWLRNFTLIH